MRSSLFFELIQYLIFDGLEPLKNESVKVYFLKDGEKMKNLVLKAPPEWYYYQTNGKSFEENYIEQLQQKKVKAVIANDMSNAIEKAIFEALNSLSR